MLVARQQLGNLLKKTTKYTTGILGVKLGGGGRCCLIFLKRKGKATVRHYIVARWVILKCFCGYF